MPAPSAPFGFAPMSGGASLSNYTPSWRDQAAYWLARNWYGDNREGVQKARRAVNIAEFTPFGFATMTDDLIDAGKQSLYSASQGNYRDAAMGFPLALGMAMVPGPDLMHGSPMKGLKSIKPSDRGPLGPGVYTTPAPQIAERYAGPEGQIYQLPNRQYDIYTGAGYRDDAGYYAYQEDKRRLVEAAEPDKKKAVAALVDKMGKLDGYPLYVSLSQLYGSDKGAQDLFKRAGFDGLSGLVDGPETLLFNEQNLHGLTEPKTIRAYHGSPYDFNAERRVRMPDGYEQYIVGQPDVLPDIPPGATVLQDYPLGRFREDKIGTGEGAAAYGHGAAYVAEEERVARDYRDQLQWKGANFNDVQVIAQNALDRFRGDRAAAADSLQSAVDSITRFYRGKVPAHQAKADKDVEDAIALLRSDAEITGKPPKPGKMYEVQINADPDQFLDWDKPLSEQPESVRTYFGGDPEFNAVVSKNPGNPFYNVPLRSPPTGAELWRKIVGTDDPVKRRQSAQGAAKKLAEMGIPGIKYLDQGSRTKGDGSRNYVVFDDSLVQILRKYGLLPAMLGGGAMFGSLAPQDTQQQ